MRNLLRSSRTCLRPLAMNSSNRSVKRAMRSRRSSKPKVMAGRLSAIEEASAMERGARMALVEREGSKRVDIVVMSSSYWITLDAAINGEYADCLPFTSA